MINKTRLAEKCSTWNIALSPAQLDQLDRYAEILVDYNQKANLTAITSPEGIEDRHFADSLLFAAQPEVQGKMVDVGTGAGFPGIVAKIYKPDLQLTHFVRVLPAAGQGRRRVFGDEGSRSRRRSQSQRQCLKEIGRRLRRDPHLYPARWQRPRAGAVQKNIANSDRLPPKRRKNCKKTAVKPRNCAVLRERF